MFGDGCTRLLICDIPVYKMLRTLLKYLFDRAYAYRSFSVKETDVFVSPQEFQFGKCCCCLCFSCLDFDFFQAFLSENSSKALELNHRFEFLSADCALLLYGLCAFVINLVFSVLISFRTWKMLCKVFPQDWQGLFFFSSQLVNVVNKHVCDDLATTADRAIMFFKCICHNAHKKDNEKGW